MWLDTRESILGLFSARQALGTLSIKTSIGLDALHILRNQECGHAASCLV